MRIIRNKTFLTILNIVVAIAAGFYVVYELRVRVGQAGVFPGTGSWDLFFIVLVLLPVNLGLEAQKWRIAVAKEQRVSFVQAFFYVVTSLPYGVLTPSRVGEWYGRARNMEKTGRGVVLGAMTGIAQQIVTVVAGVAGLLYLGKGDVKLWLIAGIALFILGFIVVLILNRHKTWYNTDLMKEKGFVKVFILSVIRYLVFSTQFVLLMMFFGVKAGIGAIYSAIAAGYLFSYFLPLNSIVELGIRMGTVLYIMSGMGVDPVGVVWATLMVWVINIVLPSLAGSILIVREAVKGV